MTQEKPIIVFTDGSSRGNPGPGGWGALIIAGDKVFEIGGHGDRTTNNRMEMNAALQALLTIEERKLPGNIEVHTDSAYVLQGVTGWMYGWEKNGWKTKTGEPVLNQDIWKDIGAVMARLKSKRAVDFIKVSGHSGLRGNERVDEIATLSADKERVLFFVGALDQYEQLLGGSVFSGGGEKKKPAGKSGSKSTKTAYSYVSVIAGDVIVHKSWAQCEARVKGKPAKFKKVFSADEERALVKEWSASA